MLEWSPCWNFPFAENMAYGIRTIRRYGAYSCVMLGAFVTFRSAYRVHPVRPSVCMYPWNISRIPGRILIKFGIGKFCKRLSSHFSCSFYRTALITTSDKDLRTYSPPHHIFIGARKVSIKICSENWKTTFHSHCTFPYALWFYRWLNKSGAMRTFQNAHMHDYRGLTITFRTLPKSLIVDSN
jgi:hypothetical protein